jgi:hypothetical protein
MPSTFNTQGKIVGNFKTPQYFSKHIKHLKGKLSVT